VAQQVQGSLIAIVSRQCQDMVEQITAFNISRATTAMNVNRLIVSYAHEMSVGH